WTYGTLRSSGQWPARRSKWPVAGGQKRRGQWPVISDQRKADATEALPGTGCVAVGDGLHRRSPSFDAKFSTRRNICADESDSARCSFGAVEYCRGSGTRWSKGICSISERVDWL